MAKVWHAIADKADMGWLFRKLDATYGDVATTALSRVVLALFFGTVAGFFCLLRDHRRMHLTPKNMLLASAAIGVLAMVVAAMLQLPILLARRGLVAKALTVIFFAVAGYIVVTLMTLGVRIGGF